MKRLLVFTLLLVLTACSPAKEKQKDMYGDQLGTVRIPLSCSEEANHYVERGDALLHHMTYVGARAAFITSTELDPECAMGYWGQAMSYIHPLWSDPPSEADFKKGQSLLEKARASSQKGTRESAYITATEAYYSKGWNRNEKSNLASFSKGWEKVYRQFPDDLEAAAFYALAYLGTADPNDKTFVKQKEAGAIVEKVLAKIPDHPGAHHYIIHAYDSPLLAKDALEVAHSYGKIAPAIPHALHMPTHIYTRLGLWKESIDMNSRSAAAALQHPAGDQISLHYLHALDYLAYAYLQRAQDVKAKEVLDVLENLQGPFQPHVASAYPFAAVPARIALERHQWKKAAMLKPQTPGTYPWDKFLAMEAVTHFARALGAARSGDSKAAKQSLDKLATLREETAKTSAYWAKQIEIQRLSAQAWLTYEEGKQKEGLEMMRSAAGLEASTEKHPVTPAEVLPVREMFADMLLEMDHYKDALSEYEISLERNPNRFNSLYGAGHAAELGGNMSKAKFYYEMLIKMTADADKENARLRQAKAFLDKN
ncbi:MAG: hypothetical protein ABFS18_12705 [Thermodesulfobacteriota bacterium]